MSSFFAVLLGAEELGVVVITVGGLFCLGVLGSSVFTELNVELGPTKSFGEKNL